ncbi:hypothetical protein [Flavobacterium luminosum]|uniref:Uncharacterized protein n=1 Tax=Flavobacterium luminosum TaxID=2949086 RepID=A0ABT0TKY8_9FLAO|nr:hypothetical protein [Flavobacterium sp. HXWNR70]MCL9807749.1 hypothetical protein [Flavobacterium sp. HXWNR70]
MKKLVFLSVFGLMSVGAFASNGEEALKLPEANVETIENRLETVDSKTVDSAVKAQITVNCEDGSSYIVSCDTCTTSQLINIAIALCS